MAFGPLLTILTAAAVGVNSHPHGSPASPHSGLSPRSPTPLEQYRPQGFSTYTKNDKLQSLPLSRRSPTDSGDYITAAQQFVQAEYPNITFRTRTGPYKSSSGVGHVFFRQTVNGVDLDNGDVNVNVAKDGSIFSHGGSVYTGPLPGSAPDLQKLKKPAEALSIVASKLDLPVNMTSITTSKVDTASFVAKGAQSLQQAPTMDLVYYRSADSIIPAWRVESDTGNSWYTAYVQADAGDNTVLALSDYSSHASFNVYPFTASPLDASREIVKDPENKEVDPNGWNTVNGTTLNDTSGSNVHSEPDPAQKSNQTIPTAIPATSDGPTFDYPVDLANDPTSYVSFSSVQCFFTVNRAHDLYYQLGFTEEAGNFQNDDYSRTDIGIAGDGVIISVQDSSGTNNANFMTPPDGFPGRMRMYLWDGTSPRRDSCLDPSVVLHEFTHGLSNRLTGGKRNGLCLNTQASASMGEGWSDFMATALRIKGSDTRDSNYGSAEYLAPPMGIRPTPYSTNMDTNRATFGMITANTEIHDAGYVWATALYEVLWNLIDKVGNVGTADPVFDNGIPTDGRFLAMKIVMDAMALQPCNPTYLQARDAIVDAERALTGEQNKCEVWKGFAKRGFGTDAKEADASDDGEFNGATDGFAVPDGC